MKTMQTVIGAAVAALGAFPSANAVPVSLSQTVSLGQLLQGNGTTVQFDITGLLAGNGLTSQSITSANLVVYGVSEANYQAPATQYNAYVYQYGNPRAVYYGYSYIAYAPYYSCYYYWSGGRECYVAGYYSYTQYVTGSYWVSDSVYLRSNDINRVDNVADKMTVSAGNSTAEATAVETTSSSTPYGSQILDISGGSYSYGYQDYYSRYRDVYHAIEGDLEVAMGLDAAALSDLMLDGMLGIGVSAFGQFELMSASLSFVAERQVNSPAQGVPEPGSAALTATALAALLALRNRRRIERK